MRRLAHALLTYLGYFFCGIALIGLFVPLMPSWPFALIGILLIGEESALGKRLQTKLPERMQSFIQRVRKKLRMV
jgi:uncharacterized membrane protein YbaN (DUF454 family)